MSIDQKAPDGMVRVIYFDHFDEREWYEDYFSTAAALKIASESTRHSDKSGYTAAVYDQLGMRIDPV